MVKTKPPAKKIDSQLLPSKEASDEDIVRLKPVFGIRPGVYLAFIYGAVILLAFFLVFFAQGIRRPGSVLVLSSEPFGAACRIDGVYQDAAPCEIFVSSGRHSIEMVLPGFSPWTLEIEVPERIFASLFFPKKTRVHGELMPNDPVAAFRNQADEFAAWTFTGEPSAAGQVPLSLSDGAYRLGPFARESAIREALEEILYSSLRYGVTRAALRDILRAKFLLDNQGISPSPLGLIDSARDILTVLRDNPGASAWLADLLQADAAQLISASSWYAKERADAAVIEENKPPQLGNQIMLKGLRFWAIPAGYLVQGAYFPRKVPLESFFIAEAEPSRRLWEDFLNERPEWRPENTEALVRSGLVSNDYLKDPKLPGAPSPEDKDNPITSVSWYAALAFCEWFSSSLPPAYSGWELRLPCEAEWEYAARALPKMLRNHWEWCADHYTPLDFFQPDLKFYNNSPERSLRGGSWFNQANSINTDTRASLPPEICSVFVSFRPVLAQKTGAAALD
jgi:hypothetical protein